MLSKSKILETFLDHATAVLIGVDTSYPDVDLPSPLMQDDVYLQLGYMLSPRIPDLRVTEDEVTATLSFNGTPYRCRVPMGAMFQVRIANSDYLVNWPREVEVEYEVVDFAEPGIEEPATKPRHLKLVD